MIRQLLVPNFLVSTLASGKVVEFGFGSELLMLRLP
jgi:uncharacterized protein (UPF0261 family)